MIGAWLMMLLALAPLPALDADAPTSPDASFESGAAPEEPPAETRAPEPPALARLARVPVALDAVPNDETVVKARSQAATAPRDDQSAAASVVVPDDSPRLTTTSRRCCVEAPGINVVRTGSIGASRTRSRCAARTPTRCASTSTAFRSTSRPAAASTCRRCPIGDVERVEVYRGSSPLEFGESALGGVISITTRTPGVRRAARAHRHGLVRDDVRRRDGPAGGRPAAALRRRPRDLARGDYPYLNDNGTAFNPADDVYGCPGRTTTSSRCDGVLRAGVTLAGRRYAGPGRDRLRARARAAWPGHRLPTMRGALPDPARPWLPALRIA